MRREKAAKISKRKRKGQLIAIGVIAAIAVGAGIAIYFYMQNPPPTAGFGAVGSAHEHAAMKVFINDQEPVNFALPQYQVKSRFVHFEDNNGVIVHRHATGVHMGFLFNSIGMDFNDRCITLVNGTSYCNEGDNTLKMYVNGVRNNMYDEYVPNDGDKILITYGHESEEEIMRQLNTLDLIPIPTGQS